MRTILPAHEDVANLWGYPKPKETVYRLMRYLLWIDIEDGVLLHNCVTGNLILLTNEEAELLSHIHVKPTERVRELIANHFLVPENFDEYSSVKQLRRICQSRGTGNAINHYVILPTTFCNAHCFYCYESDYPRVHMTEETASKLVDFMEENRKDKDIVINWFGGEPLVGIKRIDQISQALKERGISYSSSMISNGYLFDEETVNKSVELWKMNRVQITLDGTEEVYNRVKAYANVTDNPFQRVMRNIDLLISRGVVVDIRLNIGFHNQEDIRMLIEELGGRFSGNKYIGVYLSMLFDGMGYEPVSRPLKDTLVLMKVIEGLTERLKELKLFRDNWKAPILQVKQCIADNPHSVVIQPDGGFCKCEHESVLDSYGNLDEGILDPQKPLNWKETIERSEHCDECQLYPDCYLLSQCMNARVDCVEELRCRHLERHKKHLRTVYQKSLEDVRYEKV